MEVVATSNGDSHTTATASAPLNGTHIPVAPEPNRVEAGIGASPKAVVKPSASLPPAGARKLSVTSNGVVNVVGDAKAAVKLTGAQMPSGVKITAGTPGSPAPEMPSGYKPIDKNIYVCRQEIKLRPHELPRCHCQEGETCSPSTCENARIFIECSPERCTRGKACKNQRFQKRQYAGVAPKRSGAKGWGIFAQLPISAGQFVLEYVGEVIDADELDTRSQACANEPHFYFLSLSGGETIDASKKGNISRFINHSCDPNCVTQKWQVNGESRVGIFALRNIRVGEELTFDYQFERFSHKKQRCLCGASNCSKYLGSKPKPKDGQKPIKKKRDEIRYCEVSEAILPDEHVAVLLDDQNIDTFPFKPIDERWYFLPKSKIPLESDTEEESDSESSHSSDEEDVDEKQEEKSPSGGSKRASEENDVSPPRKAPKIEEHATPHATAETKTKMDSSKKEEESDSSSDERPQHPTRSFVNKVEGRAPLFRRTSAYNQRLALLDLYSDMLYDKIDTQKEKKTLMQNAELAAMSTLVGVDASAQQTDWMASLDLKQLMRDGLLEFDPASASDRAARRRSSTRSAAKR